MRYACPFDASKPDAPGPGNAVQVSKDGSIGMITWRQDGKELYFMTRNWEVMAVEVDDSDVQSGSSTASVQPAGSSAR